MYWVVFSIFSLIETFSDVVLFWLPFYYALKVAFLLYCQVRREEDGSALLHSIRTCTTPALELPPLGLERHCIRIHTPPGPACTPNQPPQMPMFRGAEFLYSSFVRPVFLRNQPAIDLQVREGRMTGAVVAAAWAHRACTRPALS